MTIINYLEVRMFPRKEFEKLLIKTSSCWFIRVRDTNRVRKSSRPQLSYESERDKAAHWAWRIYRGEILEGKNICHSCDDSRCVNPDHLFLGTQSDNIKDAVAKDRWTHVRGPRPSMQGKNHWNYKHGRRVGI